ncbi:MAG: hypothetical protein ACFFFH_07520 [Candidatus Thorarchaeota archaeon]
MIDKERLVIAVIGTITIFCTIMIILPFLLLLIGVLPLYIGALILGIALFYALLSVYDHEVTLQTIRSEIIHLQKDIQHFKHENSKFKLKE